MGETHQGLRLLRLMLLGGGLAGLWLLLTAADSSATPGQEGRSLPIVGEVRDVRGVLESTGNETATEVAASGAPEKARTEPRKPLSAKPGRVVSDAVELAASDLVAVADTTLRDTEDVSSAVVDVVASTTEELAVAPVVAPVVDPVVDAVEAVVDVVPLPEGAVIPPSPSTDDAVPPAVSEPMNDEVLPAIEASRVSSPTPVMAGPRSVPGPAAMSPATGAAPWLTGLLQETKSTTAATQQASHGSHRSSLPTAPAPVAPASSVCQPGTASGGGGQLDPAADRGTVLAQVLAVTRTCPAGGDSSVPGPSALPGFSPE